MHVMCMCYVYVCAGGVSELHPGAAVEQREALYLWHQCFCPHLRHPAGRNESFKVLPSF